MNKIKVRVWCDNEDDADVITADERADPVAIVKEYCEDKYDNDWPDFVTVFLLGPNDKEPRVFSARVKHEITFSVNERRK